MFSDCDTPSLNLLLEGYFFADRGNLNSITFETFDIDFLKISKTKLVLIVPEWILEFNDLTRLKKNYLPNI